MLSGKVRFLLILVACSFVYVLKAKGARVKPTQESTRAISNSIQLDSK